MTRSLNFGAALLLGAGLFLGACSSPAPISTPTAAPNGANASTSIDPESIPFSQLPASDPLKVGATGRPQVVDFFAYWCTTCKAMHPVFASLEKEYAGRVDFLYIDIDAANTKEVQRTFNFTGLRPTIIFLDANGKEINRLFGERPREEIAKILDNLVAVGG